MALDGRVTYEEERDIPCRNVHGRNCDYKPDDSDE